MKIETLLPLGKLDPGLARPESPLDLHAVGADAALVDQLGYDSLLMEETKDDPFAVLAIAAQQTRRVHVGTSVAIAFARSPYVTAMSAWTAQKLSGGRFELGLGSQVRGHIRRRFGLEWHPPGPWMRDYVRAVRAIWHSWQHEQLLDFSSQHYALNLSVPLFTPDPIAHPAIPVQVAAVNPYMIGVAAEVADGVRLHPVCSARYINDLVHPTTAAKRPDDAPFEICLKPLVAAGPNEAVLNQRRETARQRLAFYVSTPAYRGAFDRYGLNDLADELAVLSKSQRWNDMAARIDDDTLDQWVISATYEQLAAAVQTRFAGLIDRIELSIPVGSANEQEQLREIVAAIQTLPGSGFGAD
ncbi:MAG: TIGR03617 family F420-dependent LLM class oxidoreductase [Pseudomonadales bacterium]